MIGAVVMIMALAPLAMIAVQEVSAQTTAAVPLSYEDVIGAFFESHNMSLQAYTAFEDGSISLIAVQNAPDAWAHEDVSGEFFVALGFDITEYQPQNGDELLINAHPIVLDPSMSAFDGSGGVVL